MKLSVRVSAGMAVRNGTTPGEFIVDCVPGDFTEEQMAVLENLVVNSFGTIQVREPGMDSRGNAAADHLFSSQMVLNVANASVDGLRLRLDEIIKGKEQAATMAWHRKGAVGKFVFRDGLATERFVSIVVFVSFLLASIAVSHEGSLWLMLGGVAVVAAVLFIALCFRKAQGDGD